MAMANTRSDSLGKSDVRASQDAGMLSGRGGRRKVLHLGVLAALLAVRTPGAGAAASGEGFRMAAVTEKSLGLWEGDRPVLVYNHGVIRAEGVPDDRKRSTYVHPLYGLDGEVLTDDFPKDHYHHRGLFWAWPHVRVAGGKEVDLWMLQGIEQRFERWLERKADAAGATLDVENGWYVDGRRVVRERVRLRVHPATTGSRAVDVELEWTPLAGELSLAGAEGKSYGGLTLRYGAGTNVTITVPQGVEPKDLAMARLPWADLSLRLEGRSVVCGAAVFIAPDHPDYPPTWLTRHYGVLCVGWPGVEARAFPEGKSFGGKYRIWVHRGQPTPAMLAEAYAAYAKTASAH